MKTRQNFASIKLKENVSRTIYKLTKKIIIKGRFLVLAQVSSKSILSQNFLQHSFIMSSVMGNMMTLRELVELQNY